MRKTCLLRSIRVCFMRKLRFSFCIYFGFVFLIQGFRLEHRPHIDLFFINISDHHDRSFNQIAHTETRVKVSRCESTVRLPVVQIFFNLKGFSKYILGLCPCLGFRASSKKILDPPLVPVHCSLFGAFCFI